MNRNEFENWMKDKLEDQQFPPGEDLWQKLNNDLQKPSGNGKRLLILPFLKLSSVKIAASVVIILSLGVAGTYLFRNNESKNTPDVAVEKNTESPQLNNHIDSNNSSSPSSSSSLENIASTEATSNTKQSKGTPALQHSSGDTQLQSKSPLIQHEEPTQQPQIAQAPQNTVQPAAQDKTDNKEPAPKVNPYKQPQPNSPNDIYYAQNNDNKHSQAVNIGMAANVGSSTISNVAYQVGVVGRGNISKRVFVETGVLLASNTVSNSSTHTFSGVQFGGDGLTNTETKSMTSVQANYSRNIISVGVTPSVGVKVTRRLSVSGGGAIYRNLNPSLELTNGDNIEQAALNKEIISTTQKVTNWDLGLTCNADYKVTKHLSFNVNYRKGLTDYLQTETKFIKNSGVQLGVKYLFGK